MAIEGTGGTSSTKKINIPCNADFGFGAGNFSLYLYMQNHNVTSGVYFSCDNGSTKRQWSFQVGATSGITGKLALYILKTDSTYESIITNNYCITQSVWHQVFIGRDGASTGFAYVDGVAQAVTVTGAGTMQTDPPTNVVLMDLDKTSSSSGFDGYIAEAAVWNRALSQTEMAQICSLKNRDIHINYSLGLMGYWRLDDWANSPISGADSAIDLSGRGHHGTPANSPNLVSGPHGLGYPDQVWVM